MPGVKYGPKEKPLMEETMTRGAVPSWGRRMWNWATGSRPKETSVYFIPGMCYNCKVFDKLRLPIGYRKKYLEWTVPRPDETLEEYARSMARGIDPLRPFVLVGYSFGAVIMQEMTRFLQPEKCVVLSSFKRSEEIPPLFKAVRKTNLARRMPMRVYHSTDFITGAFNHLLFHASNEEFAEFMTQTDPVYIRWAVERITEWVPANHARHLYHIHGTQDQIFPYERLQDVFPVEGGDHLMVFKQADTVSSILDSILLKKETD